MTIDWFTFAAQILNFLVLIWLMKKFLYGPIINAMEQREAKIAARQTDAAAALESARVRENEYHKALDELASTRQEQLAQASREVEEWRQDHIQQAKSEVEVDRDRWQESLAREKSCLLQEIQLNVTTLATDLSRHVMKDMANESLQGLIVNRFLQLIRNPKRDALQMHSGNQHPIVIETSHELSEPERNSIRDAVFSLDSSSSNLEFRINRQLVCGIELRSPRCKLGWNIRDSLSDLKSDVLKHLQQIIPGTTADESNQPAKNEGTEPVSS